MSVWLARLYVLILTLRCAFTKHRWRSMKLFAAAFPNDPRLRLLAMHTDMEFCNRCTAIKLHNQIVSSVVE